MSCHRFTEGQVLSIFILFFWPVHRKYWVDRAKRNAGISLFLTTRHVWVTFTLICCDLWGLQQGPAACEGARDTQVSMWSPVKYCSTCASLPPPPGLQVNLINYSRKRTKGNLMTNLNFEIINNRRLLMKGMNSFWLFFNDVISRTADGRSLGFFICLQGRILHAAFTQWHKQSQGSMRLFMQIAGGRNVQHSSNLFMKALLRPMTHRSCFFLVGGATAHSGPTSSALAAWTDWADN